MNTQALLTLVMALLAVLLLLSFPLVSLLTRQVKRQRKKRMNIVVTATITHIQVKANMLSSAWQMTATWTVPHTGQLLTFHSPLLPLRPKQRVGDRVLVLYDTDDPSDYVFELE